MGETLIEAMEPSITSTPRLVEVCTARPGLQALGETKRAGSDIAKQEPSEAPGAVRSLDGEQSAPRDFGVADLSPIRRQEDAMDGDNCAIVVGDAAGERTVHWIKAERVRPAGRRASNTT